MLKSEAKEAVAAGLDPLLEKSWRELLSDIPKRIVALISKLIGFRTAILAGCGWLVFKGAVDSWAFVAIAVIAVFGRDGLKFLGNLKDHF